MTRSEALDILEHNWTRLVNADYSDKELGEALSVAIQELTKENYERVWITDGKRQANILYDKSRQLYWMNCYAVEFAKKVLNFKIIDGEDAE